MESSFHKSVIFIKLISTQDNQYAVLVHAILRDQLNWKKIELKKMLECRLSYKKCKN